MARSLNIKDREAYELASEIARATGKSLTRVVVDALKHEKDALKPTQEKIDVARVHQILEHMHAMQVVDPRSTEEILADLYDERGLPK